MADKKEKNLIVVILIDFRKAYDSIKRDKNKEVLMEYKIHPEMIDATTEILTIDRLQQKLI